MLYKLYYINSYKIIKIYNVQKFLEAICKGRNKQLNYFPLGPRPVTYNGHFFVKNAENLQRK